MILPLGESKTGVTLSRVFANDSFERALVGNKSPAVAKPLILEED